MPADLTVTIAGTPVPIYLGENTSEAARLATLAQTAADLSSSTAAALGNAWPELVLALSAAPQIDKIVEGSGSVSPSVYRSYAFVSGTVYEVALLAAADERRFLNVYCQNGALIDTTFDLVAGVVLSAASGNTATITPLGRGLYLCQVTRTATVSTTNNLQVRMVAFPATYTYTGDGSSGMYAGSVKFSVASVGVDLFPSRRLSDASWTKAGVTIASAILSGDAAGAAIDQLQAALDGANPARLTEASGAGRYPVLYREIAFVSGSSYRLWAKAKADERKRLNIYCHYDAVLIEGTFDLENGTASGTGASISYLGAGEWLCEVEGTVGSTNTGVIQLRIFPDAGVQPYTGDGTSGLYVRSAGADKDGVALITSTADDLASVVWTEQDLTAAVDTGVSLGGVNVRLAALETGDAHATPLAGKKWAALGTSITIGGAYTSALASLSGMVLTNLGVSGASLASGSHSGSLGIYNAIASIPSDTEIVTLEAGINDFGTSNSNLGALGDTTTVTFHGAIYAAVAAIRAQAPDAKIVFFVPYSGGAGTATHKIGVTNGKGLKLQQFQQAVREGAAYCGYPFIDINESGIGYFTAAAYTSDDLHLNAAGGERYGGFVNGELLRLEADGFFD